MGQALTPLSQEQERYVESLAKKALPGLVEETKANAGERHTEHTAARVKIKTKRKEATEGMARAIREYGAKQNEALVGILKAVHEESFRKWGERRAGEKQNIDSNELIRNLVRQRGGLDYSKLTGGDADEEAKFHSLVKTAATLGINRITEERRRIIR